MTQGPTKIPPQQIAGPPVQGTPQTPPTKPSPNVILEKLPAELSDVRTITRVKGEVVRDNRDGTLQIRTEKGDIEVRADSRELNLRQGDQVEVEIPPGRPPQTASLTREAETPAPPRTTQTPVDVEVRPGRSPETPPSLPAILREGQAVRLQPIPDTEAGSYAPIPVETVVSQITESFTFNVHSPVQDAEHFIAIEILKIIAEPLTAIPIGTQIIAPVPIPNAQALLMPAPLPVVSQNAFPSVMTVLPATTELAPRSLIPGAAGGTPMQAAIPPTPGISLSLPDLVAFSLTVQPNAASNAFPQSTQAILEPFRAEISTLEQTTSPAILTPKIPPSPLLTPDALMKTLDKPVILSSGKAGEIPAIVVGQTSQNLPVIGMISPATGEQAFFIMHINGGAVLPGTELTLVPQQQITQMPANAPIMATVSFAPAPSYFLAPESWPLMNDIYQALAQIMPRAAQAMNAMTPSPNNPAQIGPAALFFIAAVRGGDLTQWLGSNSSDALRRGGKSGLLERLGFESSTLNKLATDNVSGEWRAVSLPLMWENQVQKIALYYKNDSRQEQDNNPEARQHRFLFDLSLDAMGPVQIDGLFRAQRLDLIVRAKEPFSAAMQTEMRRIYAGALGKTSITGDLSFQNRPDQWVTITPDKKNIGVSI
jgi:hypothetical protein